MHLNRKYIKNRVAKEGKMNADTQQIYSFQIWSGNKKQKAIYLRIEIRYNIIKVNNYVYIKALLCKYG